MTAETKYNGAEGWKLSKKHEAIMHAEMQRLAEGLPEESGSLVSYDLYVWGGSDPGAFLHGYVDGCGDYRWDGVRYYATEVDGWTKGAAVRAVFDNLHQAVDEALEAFRAHPEHHRTRPLGPHMVLI